MHAAEGTDTVQYVPRSFESNVQFIVAFCTGNEGTNNGAYSMFLHS